MQSSAATIDPDADVNQVIAFIKPAIQNLINQGLAFSVLLWGINMNFAELLVLRGGNDSPSQSHGGTPGAKPGAA